MSLRLVFLGSSEFAVPTLGSLLEAGHPVSAVYTRAPKLAGRGMEERATPIHRLAIERQIPVRTPASFADAAEQAAFADLEADAAVVVAYGVILRRPILETPRLGCFNVHPSLLPRWRGAAPIERAILAGDPETGISIMRMDEGLDTGPVCLSKSVSLDDETPAGELHDRLAAQGAALMVEALTRLERGDLELWPQATDGVTYAAKLVKAEARIDFARPANEVLRHIHAFSPRPGAFAEIEIAGTKQRLKILKAEHAAGTGAPGSIIDADLAVACATGAVRPILVQRPGKSALARREFLRGLVIGPGMRFA
ncbi:MAG: methionyl-tRNA formyltransferase [Pseudomonadota bacterium]|nr:methionyl-tRNA formyltransferase [Pseudomonadota bacterium]